VTFSRFALKKDVWERVLKRSFLLYFPSCQLFLAGATIGDMSVLEERTGARQVYSGKTACVFFAVHLLRRAAKSAVTQTGQQAGVLCKCVLEKNVTVTSLMCSDFYAS
jgi:hypothetical protein